MAGFTSAPALAPALKLAAPIVGTATDPRGGYWEVGADGGVFSYGGAKFYGSLPGEKIRTRKIVGICPNRDGKGYWLLSSTGTVYAFGNAPRLGNAGPGASAIIPDRDGYRVIYSDGKSVTFLIPAQSSNTLADQAALPSSGSSPPASLMPDSLFNQDVQSWPVNPSSAAHVSSIVAQYTGAYGQVGVNFNRPVYDVPAGQAMVPVSVSSGCNDFTGDQASPNGNGATGTEVPIPSFATAGNSSDNILTVYQPSTDRAWELWEAVNNGNGTWSACWGGELNMATSNGVFPDPYGETAAGISNLATEITESDIASGSINHAIGMEVLGDECDWSTTSAHGGLYPADRTDCGNSIAGAPAEGQWFRFPANLAMPSGLTPFAQMVFKAVQTYGMVVVDQGGAVMLEADEPSVWSQEGNSGTDPINASTNGLPEYKLVASLPWTDLQAIDPPH